MSTRTVDYQNVIKALSSTSPSSAAPKYISLKNASHVTVYISGTNNATGSSAAITLNQATAVAGTSAKTLNFDRIYANTVSGTGDTFTEIAVTTNSWTTNATAALSYAYIVEVDASTLDVTNGFDCFSVGIGNSANTTLEAHYIVRGVAYVQRPVSGFLAD